MPEVLAQLKYEIERDPTLAPEERAAEMAALLTGEYALEQEEEYGA
jgi:hypothetical protein